MFPFNPVTQTFLYFMYSPPILPTNDVHLILVLNDDSQGKKLFVSVIFKTDGSSVFDSTHYSDEEAESFIEELVERAPCEYIRVELNTKSIKMATHALHSHLPFLIFQDYKKDSEVSKLNKMLSQLRGE